MLLVEKPQASQSLFGRADTGGLTSRRSPWSTNNNKINSGVKTPADSRRAVRLVCEQSPLNFQFLYLHLNIYVVTCLPSSLPLAISAIRFHPLGGTSHIDRIGVDDRYATMGPGPLRATLVL
jgi:hypothetical protein